MSEVRKSAISVLEVCYCHCLLSVKKKKKKKKEAEEARERRVVCLRRERTCGFLVSQQDEHVGQQLVWDQECCDCYVDSPSAGGGKREEETTEDDGNE